MVKRGGGVCGGGGREKACVFVRAEPRACMHVHVSTVRGRGRARKRENDNARTDSVESFLGALSPFSFFFFCPGNDFRVPSPGTRYKTGSK